MNILLLFWILLSFLNSSFIIFLSDFFSNLISYSILIVHIIIWVASLCHVYLSKTGLWSWWVYSPFPGFISLSPASIKGNTRKHLIAKRSPCIPYTSVVSWRPLFLWWWSTQYPWQSTWVSPSTSTTGGYIWTTVPGKWTTPLSFWAATYLAAHDPSKAPCSYKILVRPQVEYASTLWDHNNKTHINKIEAVQWTVAINITEDYSKESSVTSVVVRLVQSPVER